MSARVLFAVLSLLVPVFAVGCAPDCRLVCEKQEDADCEGAADTPDCENECLHTQDLVTNAGCQQDFDNYLLCIDSLDDVCDAVAETCTTGESCKDPKCDNEANTLGKCINHYCTHHPNNNECQGLVAPAAP